MIVLFTEQLRRSRLILPGERVLVALSGGLDSVVLLDLLLALRADWELDVAAAHFDHRMRSGSAEDAAWVQQLCRGLGVSLEVGVAGRAPRSEAAARALRYRFLRAAARRRHADRIATAHHADDQVETVLFRAARGTGLRGLSGIPSRRGRLVRPLLPFRRAVLEAHAAVAGLEHREDPTNREPGFARNVIRHEVLPALRRAAPGADRSLLRLSREARAEESAWEWVLRRLESDAILERDESSIVLARACFLDYHPQIRGRLLRRLLRRLGSFPDRAGTRAALAFISSGASGRAVRAAGGVVIEREFDAIRLRAPAAAAEPDRALAIPSADPGSGTARIGGRELRIMWGNGPAPGSGESVALARRALRFPLELRGWQPGDRIERSYGTKKLKKLLAERRIGRAARRRVPVLADADGRVLWVTRLARAAGVDPAPDEPAFFVAVEDAEFS